jgi:hypothetical protein
MRLALLAVALSVAVSASSTESVRYAAFKLERNGTRTMIAEGTREYSPETDIHASNIGGNSSRRLLLFDAFELELRFERGHPLDGFGLVISNRKSIGSFSFNWFEREQGAVFVKTRPRQSGRVRLAVVTAGRVTEPAAVEFLDDITLRFTDDLRNHSGDPTHEFVIARGSVLRVVGAP